MSNSIISHLSVSLFVLQSRSKKTVKPTVYADDTINSSEKNLQNGKCHQKKTSKGKHGAPFQLYCCSLLFRFLGIQYNDVDMISHLFLCDSPSTPDIAAQKKMFCSHTVPLHLNSATWRKSLEMILTDPIFGQISGSVETWTNCFKHKDVRWQTAGRIDQNPTSQQLKTA